jgi:hypothetical protein
MLHLLNKLWHREPQFPRDVVEAVEQADIIGLCLSRYTREHFEKVLELLGKMHPQNLRIETAGADMNQMMCFERDCRSPNPSYFLCEAPMKHRVVDIYNVLQHAQKHIPGIHSTALVRPGISHTQKRKSAQFVANPDGHELLLQTLERQNIDTMITKSVDGIAVLSDFFRRHIGTVASSPLKT